MRRTELGLLCVGLLQIGCGNGPSADTAPADDGTPVGAPTQNPGNGTAFNGQAGAGSMPTDNNTGFADPNAPPPVTDTRAAIIAATPPPAISGGTMLVVNHGLTVIAADPDRDRVSIVDLAKRKVTAQVALETGDEPGRLVQDAQGRVHIVLRGAGAVATLDLTKGAITDRRAVCGAPRGIAYDADADVLHVACLSGDLLTLPAAGGKATRNMRIADDLRDVVVQDGRLLVSQFKSAALLELDADGQVTQRSVPSAVHQFAQFPQPNGQVFQTFSPALARRAMRSATGARSYCISASWTIRSKSPTRMPLQRVRINLSTATRPRQGRRR